MLLDNKISLVRTDAILTTSYVAGTVLETHLRNQLVLYLKYTKGSLTSLEIKVEFSHDNSTWFQETFTSVSSGTRTGVLGETTFAPAASANLTLTIPIMHPYVKIWAKGTGTVTNSSLEVRAGVGTV